MNHKTKSDQSHGPPMVYLLIIMVVSVVSHFQTLDHSRNYLKLVFDVSFTMIWGVGSRALLCEFTFRDRKWQWTSFPVVMFQVSPSLEGRKSCSFFLICPT